MRWIAGQDSQRHRRTRPSSPHDASKPACALPSASLADPLLSDPSDSLVSAPLIRQRTQLMSPACAAGWRSRSTRLGFAARFVCWRARARVSVKAVVGVWVGVNRRFSAMHGGRYVALVAAASCLSCRGGKGHRRRRPHHGESRDGVVSATSHDEPSARTDIPPGRGKGDGEMRRGKRGGFSVKARVMRWTPTSRSSRRRAHARLARSRRARTCARLGMV